MQHRVAVVDSRENQAACMHASVGGICGGSLARGNCIIVLRLTRGYRKSVMAKFQLHSFYKIILKRHAIKNYYYPWILTSTCMALCV